MATAEATQTQLRGEVIQRGTDGYDEARAVYNGMIDRYPATIVRPIDAGEVIDAVHYGRERGMDIAIRGGGHNGGGLGTVNDGLVIDLSKLKGVRVDPAARTARVGGGALLREVDQATHAFGLATPSGIFGTTGVGGITLGGGLGYLSRKFGLAIDNVLEADMVLADGRFVTVNADNHSDLFWAIRGGGGNFGVVTSFLFQLHELHTIIGGPMLWEIDKAHEIMAWYREFIVDAPDDINGFFAFLAVPPVAPFPEHLHTKTMCGIVWCYTGPHDQADGIYDPIRKRFGPPALDWVGPMPVPVLQTMFDGLYPPGQQWYWRADFVKELPDAAIDRHIQYGSNLASIQSTMHLYPINGAAGRVGASDTAWAYRDAVWGAVYAGVDPDPNNADKVSDWAKSYQEALHPYSMGGAYVNMMMDDEGQERVRASYRHNYERLTQVKAKYDPDNVFHVNQNIKPARA
ncbi:MAG: FAD-binding oxidoreductase [Caldilineaceae bacterium]|nr:FAD-binding oxidoreductase [Caldilineaceae bacterium]